MLTKIVNILIKLFCIGLLLQFFLHTLFTYKFGREGELRNFVWLRKELILGIFLLILLVLLVQKGQKVWRKNLRSSFRQHQAFPFFLGFVLLLVLTAVLALGVQKVGIGAYILSIKYDLLSFMIFLIGLGLAWLLPISRSLGQRYREFLKWILRGGLVRGITILTLPSFLKLFGYSRNSFEGTLTSNPPAVYYTQIDRGLPRNQFVFERPISFWFFLVAFWPLFALGYLRKQSRKTKFWWTLFRAIMVLSTISRAAIGVWFLQTGILLLLLYPKQAKKLMLRAVVPAIVLLIASVFFFKSFFAREHSNTWHLKLLISGMEIGMQHPFAGRGAGYSGPASHQLCLDAWDNARCKLIRDTNDKYSMPTIGYNPENQYVQIFMEYGLLGLIPWMFCFCWLLWTSLKLILDYLKEVKKGKEANKRKLTQLLMMIAFGLGLRGLAVEGLVLHSFVDRMMVYPFMLLWGVLYGHINPLQIPEQN